MRRRLIWGGIFASAAGIVIVLYFAFPSPKPSKDELISNIPGDVVKQEKPVKFQPRKKAVLDVARAFVQTAIARKNVGDSWNLVTKLMRAGYSKKAWSS